jgi:hypothetical protein
MPPAPIVLLVVDVVSVVDVVDVVLGPDVVDDVDGPLVVELVDCPVLPPEPAPVGDVDSSTTHPLLITKYRGMATAVVSRMRFMGTLRRFGTLNAGPWMHDGHSAAVDWPGFLRSTRSLLHR